MTTISAQVIAKSRSTVSGKVISTVRCRYPRWIHAEGRTHRLLAEGEDEFEMRTPSPMQDPNLSRNAASSRAIPVKRLIEDIRNDPAVPIFWGANQKGMQAGAECNASVTIKVPQAGKDHNVCELFYEDHMLSREAAWLKAMDNAIELAEAFDAAGYHKQIVNRLLEPFSHINVLFTATEWDNFFALRIHSAAEPHIYMLAKCIRDAIEAAPTRDLDPGQWHLPYADREEDVRMVQNQVGELALTKDGLLILSTARCAHLSYETVGDGSSIDLETAHRIYRTLIGSTPMHASPAEHQATPDTIYHSAALGEHCWRYAELHGNLVGFVQYRKTLTGEAIVPSPRVWKSVNETHTRITPFHLRS